MIEEYPVMGRKGGEYRKKDEFETVKGAQTYDERSLRKDSPIMIEIFQRDIGCVRETHTPRE